MVYLKSVKKFAVAVLSVAMISQLLACAAPVTKRPAMSREEVAREANHQQEILKRKAMVPEDASDSD